MKANKTQKKLNGIHLINMTCEESKLCIHKTVYTKEHNKEVANKIGQGLGLTRWKGCCWLLYFNVFSFVKVDIFRFFKIDIFFLLIPTRIPKILML